MLWTQKHIQHQSHCNNTNCIHYSSLLLVRSFHCRHSFSYHHPSFESPLETFSHDPHHHKVWAYHHSLEVSRVVGMSGYNRYLSQCYIHMRLLLVAFGFQKAYSTIYVILII